MLFSSVVSAQDLKVKSYKVIKYHDGGHRICYTYHKNEDVKNTKAVNSDMLSEEGTANRGISIYPNPATDFLRFKIEERTFCDISVQVFSVLGEKVLETEMSDGKELDVSTLAKGNYFVKIFDKNRLILTENFIKF
jgi:hypothetical protein